MTQYDLQQYTMSEFDLIQRYFNWPVGADGSVALGVGDDAALLHPPAGEQLAISADTFISGVHFPEDTPPHAIGHKALAVNLSDMAAVGAKPRWFTLALTLPNNAADWLEAFSRGMRELASEQQVHLVGGDTTRGPLSITVQIIGTLPASQSLLRSGAQNDDLICVTGTLGDAAAGLACIQNRLKLSEVRAGYCTQRLNYPTPRNTISLQLATLANSCIDLSDGLLADLQHILDASRKGAQLYHTHLPFSPELETLPPKQKLTYALTGGDDYELLFTLAPDKRDKIAAVSNDTKTPITVIGKITDQVGRIELDCEFIGEMGGYDHFSALPPPSPPA